MTSEEKLRGLCRVLLVAQNDEAVIRLIPRLKDALKEHGKKLNAKTSGKRKFPKVRAA